MRKANLRAMHAQQRVVIKCDTPPTPCLQLYQKTNARVSRNPNLKKCRVRKDGARGPDNEALSFQEDFNHTRFFFVHVVVGHCIQGHHSITVEQECDWLVFIDLVASLVSTCDVCNGGALTTELVYGHRPSCWMYRVFAYAEGTISTYLFYSQFEIGVALRF